MKVKYHNILVLFLATIVFFVGAGVTVIDLCCSRCVDSVMSMTLHSSDCSMAEKMAKSPSCCRSGDHAMDYSEKTVSCEGEHTHTGKCCEARRVSIDLDHSVYQPNLLHTMVWTVIPSFISNALLASDTSTPLIIDEAQEPIPILPRNYLTLIRVLII